MNIAVTQAADGPPRRAFSVADVRRMIDIGVLGEDERFELVGGEIVMMTPAAFAHELIKSALTMATARAVPSEARLLVGCGLELGVDVLVQPDLAVIPHSAFKQSAAGFVRPDRIELVIEIAASRIAYDRGVKARLYAHCGIPEFWVIDANERTAWVHTGPSGEVWSSIIERGPNDALTTPALPGFSIRLGNIE
jgi:Uma2 family endonuclease